MRRAASHPDPGTPASADAGSGAEIGAAIGVGIGAGFDPVPPDAWTGKLVPLLDLFDVLGRRWALRVIWELREAPATFRELRDRTDGVSSSVLTDRLRELRTAGVVEHRSGEGYQLTPLGCGLAERILGVYFWLKDQPGWPVPASADVGIDDRPEV